MTTVSVKESYCRCRGNLGAVGTLAATESEAAGVTAATSGESNTSMLEYKRQAGFYGSVGIGLTLAHSRKFSSHVVLRGIFMPLKPVEIDGMRHLNYDLAYAAIGIGCAF